MYNMYKIYPVYIDYTPITFLIALCEQIWTTIIDTTDGVKCYVFVTGIYLKTRELLTLREDQ